MSLSLSRRWRVLRRDNFVCQYCGSSPPDATLHVDHVQPRSDGGSDDDGNLVTACEDCNQGKAAEGVVERTDELFDRAMKDRQDAPISLMPFIRAGRCYTVGSAVAVIETLPGPGAEALDSDTVYGRLSRGWIKAVLDVRHVRVVTTDG